MSVQSPLHKIFPNSLNGFLSIYLLACGFQHVFYFPIVKDKIQIPEFVFIAALVYYILRYPVKESYTIISPFLKTIPFVIALGWLIINFISYALRPGTGGFLECMGISYLILLYLCFRAGFINFDANIFKQKITVAFTTLGWTMSSIALITYLLSVFWKPNYTAQIFYNYPYFGDAFRLQGFTTTPSMYVSIISLAIGFSLYNFLWGSQKIENLIATIFFTVISILTLSKSVIFIAFIWIALLGFKFKIHKSLIILIGIIALILQTFLTHFLIVDKNTTETQEFHNTPYTSNELIYEGADFTIFGSGYYTFKKTAWQIFKDHKWFGVGPDNYNDAVNAIKKNGLYPSNLPAYDPHSTWMGTLATTGILGFLVLIGFAVSILHKLIRLKPLENNFSYLLLTLTGVILAESISMDIMNFRHYWIFMTVLFVYHEKDRERA